MFRTITAIFFFCILLSGCSGFQLSLLRPQGQLQQRLPHLEFLVDTGSILAAYSLGRTTSHVSRFGTSDRIYKKRRSYGIRSSYSKKTTQKFLDKRVQDAITIFQREIEQNICEPPFDGAKGYAVCRIAGCNRTTNWGWYVPTACTATISLLFGVPMLSQSVEVDVALDIYSKDEKLIGTYSGLGHDTAYATLYWGCNPLDVQFYDSDSSMSRTASARALQAALTDIKSQIQRDAPMLSRILQL